jgi:outer membrane receptor protein involved in Fe transport
LGVGRDHERFSWKLNLGGAHYLDRNHERAQKEHVFAFLPSFFISTKEHPRFRVKHGLQIQHSLRMPSFNELYYNQIDSFQLDPERADQFAYTISANPFRRKWNLFVMGSGFYNRVSDKIVAIPTKNLMVWSIQNVGRALVYGGEASVKVIPNLVNEWKAEFSSAYTYLRSIDVTDVQSPTYGHQIAYTPEHMLNADISLSRRSLGGRVSSSYVSQRYALNENIAMNAVEGFLTIDLILWYRYQFKNEQSLTLQFNIKNLADRSYAYIRSFAMPGRNYLITLRYALH